MQAGKLRHVVTLQRATKTEGDYGEDALTWVDFATPYANVSPLNGREFYAAQQINDEISIKVVLRYRADVKASDRVLYNGQILQIVAPPIDVNTRHRTLQLLCKVIT